MKQLDGLELEASLLSWFQPCSAVVVAFSGGVDSTVVAAAAVRALGDRARAMTADSPSVPRAELQTAIALAQKLGIAHEVIPTYELTRPDYVRNDGTRCYFCKSELYSAIVARPGEVIVSGANADDLGDYRPGLQAAAEHGIRHPLQELGFSKSAVRVLARHWNLAVAEKPASPCLASRVVPGLEVTTERLARIEAAELFLRGLGVNDCRVRYHNHDLARIELPAEELSRFLQPTIRQAVTEAFQQLGFRFVTLDLQELRSGSMNELISLSTRTRYSS